MTQQSYWKQHFVFESDADEVEKHLQRTTFLSGSKRYELMYFEACKDSPSVLISPGSGPGHVFTELAYHIHLSGYNVFMMPNNGGYTVSELIPVHEDALQHIASHWNDRIGGYAGGIGGFVLFYLALLQSPMKSVALQNAPAILTEEKFQTGFLQARGIGILARMMAKGGRAVLSLATALLKVVPGMKVPNRWLFDWEALVDTKAFVDYLKDVYNRLPNAKKRLVEIDGSMYWMVSHPQEAADVISEWFDETLS
jgi:hypothetical protein